MIRLEINNVAEVSWDRIGKPSFREFIGRYISSKKDKRPIGKLSLKALSGKDSIKLVFLPEFYGMAFDPDFTEKNVHKLNEALEKAHVKVIVLRGPKDDPSMFNGGFPFLGKNGNIKMVHDYTIVTENGRNYLCVGGGITINRSWILKYHGEGKKNKRFFYTHDEAPYFDENVMNEINDNKLMISCVFSGFFPTIIGTSPSEYCGTWADFDDNLLTDVENATNVMDKIATSLANGQGAPYVWFSPDEASTDSMFTTFSTSYIQTRSKTIVEDIRDLFNRTRIGKCQEERYGGVYEAITMETSRTLRRHNLFHIDEGEGPINGLTNEEPEQLADEDFEADDINENEGGAVNGLDEFITSPLETNGTVNVAHAPYIGDEMPGVIYNSALQAADHGGATLTWTNNEIGDVAETTGGPSDTREIRYNVGSINAYQNYADIANAMFDNAVYYTSITHG